ncbi:MAG: cyclic pyranopterin monophosphate synthase MoaC [Acidimicrobiales bacterium]
MSAVDRPGGLTHIDGHGRARMVDVTAKPLTRRVAVAKCSVVTGADASRAGEGIDIDVIEAARVAGMLAAKQTASLIPLCHPIRIDGVRVDVVRHAHRFEVSAVTEIVERTGVEMEALTACAVAALTLVKALADLDPAASIEDLTLWHKSGGRSGDWERRGPDNRMTHD